VLKVRVPDTPTHTEVKEYIISRLKQLDTSRWEITQDQFTEGTPFGIKSFTNIIATLDPHKPYRLVLAAHYDSKYFKNGQFLGATDSAVPVAIILDLVLTLDELLRNRDLQDHTLQVIFFDGEEAFVHWTDKDSLYGSRHLASVMSETNGPYSVNGKTGIEAINAFMLLDLIGSDRPHPTFYDMYQAGSKIFDRLKKIEKKLKQENQLSATAKNYFATGSISYVVQDDHIPFFDRGYYYNDILHLTLRMLMKM
jgi:glutaminyl-peptide cyclotransferase